jgi:hypothetical protein
MVEIESSKSYFEDKKGTTKSSVDSMKNKIISNALTYKKLSRRSEIGS